MSRLSQHPPRPAPTSRQVSPRNLSSPDLRGASPAVRLLAEILGARPISEPDPEPEPTRPPPKPGKREPDPDQSGLF